MFNLNLLLFELFETFRIRGYIRLKLDTLKYKEILYTQHSSFIPSDRTTSGSFIYFMKLSVNFTASNCRLQKGLQKIIDIFETFLFFCLGFRVCGLTRVRFYVCS